MGQAEPPAVITWKGDRVDDRVATSEREADLCEPGTRLEWNCLFF